jgi:hypothetical protein
MVFTKQMNTTIQEGRGKNGVHQGDESHNPGRPREKWCSLKEDLKQKEKVLFFKHLFFRRKVLFY